MTSEQIKEVIRAEKERQAKVKKLEKLQRELTTLETKTEKKRLEISELAKDLASKYGSKSQLTSTGKQAQ